MIKHLILAGDYIQYINYCIEEGLDIRQCKYITGIIDLQNFIPGKVKVHRVGTWYLKEYNNIALHLVEMYEKGYEKD